MIKADTTFRKTRKSAALPLMPGRGAHAFTRQFFRNGTDFLTLAVHVGAREQAINGNGRLPPPCNGADN